jgi:hypothetical protein
MLVSVLGMRAEVVAGGGAFIAGASCLLPIRLTAPVPSPPSGVTGRHQSRWERWSPRRASTDVPTACLAPGSAPTDSPLRRRRSGAGTGRHFGSRASRPARNPLVPSLVSVGTSFTRHQSTPLIHGDASESRAGRGTTMKGRTRMPAGRRGTPTSGNPVLRKSVSPFRGAPLAPYSQRRLPHCPNRYFK